jgi:hypothetical protein
LCKTQGPLDLTLGEAPLHLPGSELRRVHIDPVFGFVGHSDHAVRGLSGAGGGRNATLGVQAVDELDRGRGADGIKLEPWNILSTGRRSHVLSLLELRVRNANNVEFRGGVVGKEMLANGVFLNIAESAVGDGARGVEQAGDGSNGDWLSRSISAGVVLGTLAASDDLELEASCGRRQSVCGLLEARKIASRLGGRGVVLAAEQVGALQRRSERKGEGNSHESEVGVHLG